MSLTEEEISRLNTDLEITLSGEEQQTLAGLVKPETLEPWRLEAQARIEQHRKADAILKVLDASGKPVAGATVRARLVDHAFHFGAALNLGAFEEEDTAEDLRYRALALRLFNLVGLDNGLKKKLCCIGNPTNLDRLPKFFDWVDEHQLPSRGHLLIWPGGTHLPADIRALADACLSAEPGPELEAAKADLKQGIDAMIADWASRWPVDEWDVINEPLQVHEIMDILGYDQMAEWFKLAEANVVKPGARLVLNDYQIISANAQNPDEHAWSFRSRADRYQAVLDRILDEGGTIDRIGFQSRFKFGRPDPEEIYRRLDEFAGRYPVELIATEFEVRANEGTGFFPDESLRAQITEEVLTTYFSHPRVAAFTAWTFRSEEDHALLTPEGRLKLNALVWYYLYRIRWHTDETLTTNSGGIASTRGFKGEYEFTVTHDGDRYHGRRAVPGDGTVSLRLSQLTRVPEVTQLDLAGGKLSLTWISRPGKTYQIHYSTDMNAWSPLPGLDPVESSAEQTQLEWGVGFSEARFFRVVEMN